jgi:hypothetical protein
VRRGKNFRFPGRGLPSSAALRQRDAPLQLPGLRAPPAAPRVSERLLLHSPAGGGAAAPALRPPLRGARLGSALAGGAAVVRSPSPPAPSAAALPAGGRCRKCRHFGVFCSGGSGSGRGGGGGGTRRLPRDSASAARQRRLRRSKAAAEAAAGSGAAAGECGGRRITGRGMKGGKEREAGGRRRGAGQVRAATGHRALRVRSLPLPRTPGTRPRTARDSGAHSRPPGACPCSQGDPPSSWPGPGSLALCLHSPGPEGLLPAPHPSPPLRVRWARSRLSTRDAASLTLSPHVFFVPTPGGVLDSRP